MSAQRASLLVQTKWGRGPRGVQTCSVASATTRHWDGKHAAKSTAQRHAVEIYSLRVNCRVTSRFAHTVITSKIINRVNESREATFEVELPKTAFITNFSMSIDGKLYPGIIKEKASAQKEYDTAVSQGQSAGLVKITGRKLEQFHVSVSIAAASKVTFELAYEELLKRQLGLFEVLIKVRPQQLVKHFQAVLGRGLAPRFINLGEILEVSRHG
uniref:Inter-alpha-trypsin inhibitor heavy chain 4 n=1 Tax=Anas platyrhynchos platyrhynchos TaxID=8840 RepID=A0A493T5T2_ANAPP